LPSIIIATWRGMTSSTLSPGMDGLFVLVDTGSLYFHQVGFFGRQRALDLGDVTIR
jgi:hypothetical protein